MSQKLTKKQKQILDFIIEFQKANNYTPSYREIMVELGLSSPASVAEHINNLVEKGALKKTPGAARSLEVTYNDYAETVKLFNEKIASGDLDESEIETLLRAAKILSLDLE